MAYTLQKRPRKPREALPINTTRRHLLFDVKCLFVGWQRAVFDNGACGLTKKVMPLDDPVRAVRRHSFSVQTEGPSYQRFLPPP